jgi:hypothetical protein
VHSSPSGDNFPLWKKVPTGSVCSVVSWNRDYIFIYVLFIYVPFIDRWMLHVTKAPYYRKGVEIYYLFIKFKGSRSTAKQFNKTQDIRGSLSTLVYYRQILWIGLHQVLCVQQKSINNNRTNIPEY